MPEVQVSQEAQKSPSHVREQVELISEQRFSFKNTCTTF